MNTASGVLDSTPYSFHTRFEDGEKGTNPEELVGAAHAGCFAMQLSAFLAMNDTPAEDLEAKAVVTVEEVDGGFEVKSSALTLTGKVPGIDEAKFKELANKAKEECPLSKALGAIEVTLDAKLA